MKTIVHKYTLHPAQVDTILMPPGAQVLCVHEQRGEMCLWASHVPTLTPTVPRSFAILPTGVAAEFPDHAKYIGSVFINNASLVFHVYEVT